MKKNCVILLCIMLLSIPVYASMQSDEGNTPVKEGKRYVYLGYNLVMGGTATAARACFYDKQEHKIVQILPAIRQVQAINPSNGKISEEANEIFEDVFGK